MIRLEGGGRLLFTDVRRFGQAVVLDDGALEEYFAARLGIEPLSEALTGRGALPAGVRPPGAAEVVPSEPARRSPGSGTSTPTRRFTGPSSIRSRPAGSMKPEDCERLREGIVETLEAGLRGGGASVDDYLDARGERGTMQDEFLVHTREGQPCPRCGAEIRRIVVAGRSTYFCPSCQRRLRRRPRRRRSGARVRREPHERGDRPARGVRGRPLDGLRGRDRLQRRDPAGREPGRRRRSRRRAGHARDRRDRPPGRHQRGDRGAAHRRQRLRAGGGRRGDSLAGGERARLRDTRRGWCRSSRRLSSTTSRRAIPGRARGRMPAMRPVRCASAGVPERGRVGAGTGAAVGKITRAGALGGPRGSATPRRAAAAARRSPRSRSSTHSAT